MIDAGLDFDTELTEMVVVGVDGEGMPRVTEVPNRYAVIRTDTGQPLGVVGERYNPLNPRPQAEYTDLLVQAGAKSVGGMGATNDGGMDTKVYTVVEIEGDYRPAGLTDEQIRVFLFTANSFNGSTSFRTMIGAWRTECVNTLHYNVHSMNMQWTIKHTASLTENMNLARRSIQLATGWGESLVADAEELLAIPVAKFQGEQIIRDLVPVPDPKFDDDGKQLNVKAVSMANARRDQIRANWLGSDNLDNIRSTGYGLVQAVSEWHDWSRSYRSDPMARLLNRPLNGYPILNETRERVLELVG
jgi:phage/plasmid-like protein (TIGR03299 family)